MLRLLSFLKRRLFSADTIGQRRAKIVTRLWEWQQHRHTIVLARHRSMLDYETLALLLHLARSARGAIVEIGPYVGGATVVMALGRKYFFHKSEAPQIAVELGGRHDHPQLPSDEYYSRSTYDPKSVSCA